RHAGLCEGLAHASRELRPDRAGADISAARPPVARRGIAAPRAPLTRRLNGHGARETACDRRPASTTPRRPSGHRRSRAEDRTFRTRVAALRAALRNIAPPASP